jgi:polyisoprenoid-binding protein YceI
MNNNKKKPKKTVLLASGFLFVMLAGGYAAYDYYAGNHVEIEGVIPAAGQASAGQQTSEQPSGGGQLSGGQSASSAAAPIAGKLNGTWKVAAPSKVYFSVTTSKETVNFVGDQVRGEWLVDLSAPANMKGQGEADIASLSSGNGQRDGHIKGNDYLQAATYPKATFQVTSFEGVPAEWKEGQVVPLKLKGKLNVKGVDKDVTFDSNALYEQNQLKLSGSTVVTFGDYGMKNPHAVVLQTENNVTVRLELVLNK